MPPSTPPGGVPELGEQSPAWGAPRGAHPTRGGAAPLPQGLPQPPHGIVPHRSSSSSSSSSPSLSPTAAGPFPGLPRRSPPGQPLKLSTQRAELELGFKEKQGKKGKKALFGIKPGLWGRTPSSKCRSSCQWGARSPLLEFWGSCSLWGAVPHRKPPIIGDTPWGHPIEAPNPLSALPNKSGILSGAPLSPPPPSGTLPHLCGGHHPAPPPPLSLCQHPPFFCQRSVLAISAVIVNHLAGCLGSPLYRAGWAPQIPATPYPRSPFPTSSIIIQRGPFRGCGGPIGAVGAPPAPPHPLGVAMPAVLGSYWAHTGLGAGRTGSAG